MTYSTAELERTIDNLFATSHSVEDAGYITAARHMRNAADMLQAVLDGCCVAATHGENKGGTMAEC